MTRQIAVFREFDGTHFIQWESENGIIDITHGDGSGEQYRCCAACDLAALADSDFCAFHDQLDEALPSRAEVMHLSRPYRLRFFGMHGVNVGWRFIDLPAIRARYQRMRPKLLPHLRATRGADYNAYMREWRTKNRERINATQRERYATDAAYRKMKIRFAVTTKRKKRVANRRRTAA